MGFTWYTAKSGHMWSECVGSSWMTKSLTPLTHPYISHTNLWDVLCTVYLPLLCTTGCQGGLLMPWPLQATHTSLLNDVFAMMIDANLNECKFSSSPQDFSFIDHCYVTVFSTWIYHPLSEFSIPLNFLKINYGKFTESLMPQISLITWQYEVRKYLIVDVTKDTMWQNADKRAFH